MIHVYVTRDSNSQVNQIRIELTQESLDNFTSLINRGLNCWDSAPKELKDLGDMLTHGQVTQDHTYTKINTQQSTDYYSPKEFARITAYIELHGYKSWLAHVNNGTSPQIAAGKLVQKTADPAPSDPSTPT